MNAIGGESRFQRLRPLGRGGTAEVSAVYDVARKRHAALKSSISGSSDSERVFSRLAEREVRLIGKERFPGLVRILDHSQSHPSYLLLEICDGPTLDRIGRIDNWPVLLNILSSLALDLAFLKARGIIHGDIKPHNFFLPSNWQQCTGKQLFYSKLSDFSLGRFESEPESARAGAGTVGYMAPETIKDGRTSHQSDLFALGATAYQLVSGQHPFLHDDCEPVRVNARVTEDNPIPLAQLRPDITDGLATLIDSLLAKKESDRPQTAFDVCRTLEKLGAEYPYDKALRPAHLMTSFSSYGEALNASVTDDLAQNQFLATRTESDRNRLRLILTANFNRGTIRFDGNRFASNGPLYWPSRLRKQILTEFSRLRFADKRRAVIHAVRHDSESGLPDSAQSRSDTHSQKQVLSELILQLLKSKTVKRIASTHAPLTERAGDAVSASRLYVMAGELTNAERCARDAATSLRANHAPQQALAVLRRVVRFAELRNGLFEIRQALMLNGDILKETGEADKALGIYKQIVTLYEGRDSDALLAETYKDLGDLYKMKQECRAGIEALERALAIYRELDDEVEISRTLNNLGNIHWINSDFPSALTNYRSALRIQRAGDMKPEIASTLSNVASIYALRGRFGLSTRILTISLALKRELGNAGEIARTLNNLGYVYTASGQTGRAVDSLKESLEINRRIGSLKEQLFNLGNLSETTLLLGRIDTSIEYLKEGLALATELQDKPHLVTVHLTLALAYLRVGQTAMAAKTLVSARSYLDQIDFRQDEAIHLIHSARVRSFLGDNSGAIALATEAIEIATKIDDRSTCLQALLVAVQITHDDAMISRAEAIAQDLRLGREQLLLAFIRIERAIEQHDFASACEQLDRVFGSLQALEEDIELPRLLAIAAEIHFEVGDQPHTLRLIDKAHALAVRMGLLPELTVILALRARCENAANAYEQCYATTRQALQIIKQLAENIDTDSDRTSFLQRRPVQNLMVEVRRLGAMIGQKQRAE